MLPANSVSPANNWAVPFRADFAPPGLVGEAGMSVGMYRQQTDDMIDVSVRDHDGRDFQMMTLDNFQDSDSIVAGIDDDCFARLQVADNVAIALEHADWKDFVNEFRAFWHENQYITGERFRNELLRRRPTSSKHTRIRILLRFRLLNRRLESPHAS